jgi:hypothetical protein
MIEEVRQRFSSRPACLAGTGEPTKEEESAPSKWQQLGLLYEELSKVVSRDSDVESPALEPMVAIHMVYVEFGRGKIFPKAVTSLNRDGPAPAIRDTS